MLEGNFDRLHVHSIMAEVDVDDDSDDDHAEEEDATDQATTSSTTATSSLGRSVQQRPEYSEAVGDARLAWQWVEGWRARLRRGGDLVEQARWEWRLDHQIGRPDAVPGVHVTVGVPEVLEFSKGGMDHALPGQLRKKSAFRVLERVQW